MVCQPSFSGDRSARWCHAIIVGVGAIGSHLVSHLARLDFMERITIIDCDQYEAQNLRGQNITSDDIGRFKAKVQKRWVKKICSAVKVQSICDRLENLPLGLFRRASVILSCLDQRSSRVYLNEVASRVGVRWLDCGVSPDDLQARINVYLPAFDRPCYCCTLDEQDWALLDVAYSCQGPPFTPPATRAPSGLGGLAASYLALECEKLLRGEIDASQAGRELLLDACHHRLITSAVRRRPECRFDHRTWVIEPEKGAGQLPVKALVDKGAKSVWLDGHSFATRLDCPRGHHQQLLRLARRLTEGSLTCRSCKEKHEVDWKSQQDRLDLQDAGRSLLHRTLSSLGFRDGDVINIFDGSKTRHLELGGEVKPPVPAAPTNTKEE